MLVLLVSLVLFHDSCLFSFYMIHEIMCGTGKWYKFIKLVTRALLFSPLQYVQKHGVSTTVKALEILEAITLK